MHENREISSVTDQEWNSPVGKGPTGRTANAHAGEKSDLPRREPESFTFIGFTHRCGTNKSGRFVVRRQTERKRLEARLQRGSRRFGSKCTSRWGGWAKSRLICVEEDGAGPGERKPFRLLFDTVSESWNQAMPNLTIARLPTSSGCIDSARRASAGAWRPAFRWRGPWSMRLQK
jgi:hypothetical protein